MLTKPNSIWVGVLLCAVALLAWVSPINKSQQTASTQKKTALVADSKGGGKISPIECDVLCKQYIPNNEKLLNKCKSDCALSEPSNFGQCASGCDKMCDAALPGNRGLCAKDCKDACKKAFGGEQTFGTSDDDKPWKECARHLRRLVFIKDLSKSMAPEESNLPLSDDAMFRFTDTEGKMNEMSVREGFQARRDVLTKDFVNSHKSIPFGSDGILFVYDDNRVVFVNWPRCEIRGIYAATARGDIDPRVRLAVKTLPVVKGAKTCSGRCNDPGAKCDCDCTCRGRNGDCVQ